MLSGKHDGKMLQAMPLLFTYTPVEKQQAQSSATGGFQQAGGHQGVFKNSGPVLEKSVGPREKQFYEQAQAGYWPPGFLPGYYGDKGEDRIGIENLMHGMRCPCVIDLKMGTATVESSDNLMKKMKMNTLDLVTGSSSHGVRLEGMSVYRALESGKVKTTKAQSHAISAAANLNLQDVLMFFLTDESGVRRDIAQRFLGHLERILYHFEHANNQFLFIGSSILLIYDNDNTSPHSRWARALERATRLHADTYASLRRKTRVDVRMIDFAHTGPLPKDQRRDEGYITGLKSIIGALRLVRKSGVAPHNPIFSLAATAAEVSRDAAQANSNGGLAPLHESAPLLYPPQPEPPTGPHFNGGSYSFSHHHAPSAAPPLHSHASAGYPPLPGGPPTIASPPPGAYATYHPSGTAHNANHLAAVPTIAAPPAGTYALGLFAPIAPPAPAAPATSFAPAPTQPHYHAPHSGNESTHSQEHQPRQLQHQYSGACGAHGLQPLQQVQPANTGAQTQPLHQSLEQMKLGTNHAGSHSHNGHQTAPLPAAGPYGPTFATLLGISLDQYSSASAPVGAPGGAQGGPGGAPPPSFPLI